VHAHFLSISGLRLQCYEWGDPTAPPVVLLHGGSAHARWWDRFADAIADAYHVVALDLRGHGNSEHADPPAYRIEHYADDVAKCIDALGLAPVIVVGHSLGGLVSAAYAGRAPERLTALVIVDSQVKISAAGARYMRRLRHFPQPLYRDHDAAMRRFRLLPTQTNADPALLAHVAVHAMRQLPDGRWTLRFDRASLSDPEPQDRLSTLQQLRCPILLVRGVHSTLLPHDKFAALLAALPHAAGVEIPDAHHHVMLDNPPAFARAVRAFLDRVPLSAGAGLAAPLTTLEASKPYPL
jgi:pimeloyl-ACP methyl ester carboxylesterase